jgi:hypothetical protein
VAGGSPAKYPGRSGGKCANGREGSIPTGKRKALRGARGRRREAGCLKAHIEGEAGSGERNKTSLHCVYVVGEREMNIPASHNDGHLLNWLAAVLLLIGFGLGDTTIVAWSASIITFWQLVAVTFSFGLIAMGILITFWQMRR